MNSLKLNRAHHSLNWAIGYIVQLTALSVAVSWGLEVMARAFLRLG